MGSTLGALLDRQAARLVGRDRERAALLRLVSDDVPVAVFVYGLAGVGKSALLAAFAARQAVARTPLLPPRVLASRNVIGANLAQLLVIGAAMGFQVIVTLYMQRALGFGPASTGLGFTPTAAVIAVVSLGLSLGARLRRSRTLRSRRPPVISWRCSGRRAAASRRRCG